MFTGGVPTYEFYAGKGREPLRETQAAAAPSRTLSAEQYSGMRSCNACFCDLCSIYVPLEQKPVDGEHRFAPWK